MDQQAAVTITLLTLGDFVEDLRGRGIDRAYLASVCEMVPIGREMAETHYKVVCTALDVTTRAILICSFLIGKVLAFAEAFEPWHGPNANRAHGLIAAYLIDAGINVKPGMYHCKTPGRATCDLWRYDKETHELIPAVADGAAE